MLGSEDRILTTHTGSLPRPAALTSLYVRRSRGEAIDAAELDREGKAAVREVVAKQIAAGVDIPNNGEQQREAFFLYVRHRMSGFGGGWTRKVFADVTHYPAFMAWKAAHDAVNESISNVGGIPEAVGEYATWIARRWRPNARISAPRSTRAGALCRTVHDSALARHHRRGHAQRLVRHRGCVSCGPRSRAAGGIRNHRLKRLRAADRWPDLAMERHISYQDRPLGEFVGFVERVVATINVALANVPRDRVRLHACWGNYEGPHDCDVALPEVLPTIRQAKVGGFVLPFANPRHAHEYRCLKDLPLDDGQVIVAGVVDPLTNFVEHPEVIADRIELVARAVGDPRRVLAGTDCGFDTSAGRGRVADDVVWAKLASMAEGARIATKRLF